MFMNIKLALRDLIKTRRYDNYVEASVIVQFVRKVAGVSMYTIKSLPTGQITAHFSYYGFVSFIFWYFLYFYCVYRIYSWDQTILRSLYDTKLQHYGDEVERISTTVFVLYTMWKLPVDMNKNCQYVQELVDIDKAINSLGEPINFRKSAVLAFITAATQVVISLTRSLSVWLSLANIKTSFPIEKLFQVVFSDALALITTVQYCTYLHELKDRYQIINKVLNTIEVPKTEDLRMVVRKKRNDCDPYTLQFQYKDASEKLKICGKIYGMLHNASETANRKYGLSIALTMLLCFILVILYWFYFMEATASGLFHDFQKYANFLTYVFWQIAFAMGIIFLSVFFCDSTVSEAKMTSFIAHKIINSDINHLVRTEAIHLSLQIIHQLPSFTALGLYKIDYVLLLEGARTVITFLVILLQFAADTNR